jgi:hypothetical protein
MRGGKAAQITPSRAKAMAFTHRPMSLFMPVSAGGAELISVVFD